MQTQFGFRVHMLPLPKKHISNRQKIWQFFLHVPLHSLCAFVKFSRKNDIFVVCVKRQNFIKRHTTSQFFVEWLYGNIAHEDVHANFCFKFFDILKYVKDAFQLKESYASRRQNTTPEVYLIGDLLISILYYKSSYFCIYTWLIIENINFWPNLYAMHF
jgi:hypothetical protein